MEYIHVALLQLMPTGSQQLNQEKGLAACRRAKQMGADIALFPEMWNNGYQVWEDAEALKRDAISPDGEFVRSFAALARELDMAIGISFLESYEPSPRNSVYLLDRFGETKLRYAKVHTCDSGEERLLTPGDGFPVCELDIGGETVNIGAMICYDREFPESARILMLRGAELILVPNACPMEINRISQLRGRAYENMLAIATVNYPQGQPDCNGHSTAFDGMAYRGDGSGARDTLILEAGEAEGIYIAAIPIAQIREYRSREIHGNAYRHPSKYGLLVEDMIKEPFIRENYRR